ncbi:protein A10 [Aotine betaherpesvirus 1]|uniref:Protein A10 n=1 Tax=Aotine betaherpesvirus 1 TaxID=50290 RepID=G8XU83_9BETA|nr:protein A10 [Aotine betaherpesvirus 1]AEV80820.1 protein A10 [Aotine betaherpesvirus 1]
MPVRSLSSIEIAPEDEDTLPSLHDIESGLVHVYQEDVAEHQDLQIRHPIRYLLLILVPILMLITSFVIINWISKQDAIKALNVAVFCAVIVFYAGILINAVYYCMLATNRWVLLR